jgi:mannose/fructose/N-acetylgalactosamine-specific phosphotransferase system component IIC
MSVGALLSAFASGWLIGTAKTPADQILAGLLAVEFAILWAAAAIIHHIRALGDLMQTR